MEPAGSRALLARIRSCHMSPRSCPAAQLVRFALRSALVLSRSAVQIFNIAQNSRRTEPGTSPPPLTAFAI